MTETENEFEPNWEYFTKHANKILAIFVVSAFLVRMNYFPFDVPFSLDILDYFGYAINTSIFGEIPSEWFLANNGWPLFLSIFFSVTPAESFFDYTYLQRMISIIISVLTVIPVYLVCKKFFSKNIALIGSALFVFNPIVMKYSLLAGNDVLFTMIIVWTLYFMMTTKPKTLYLSFILVGVLTVIRYEGLLLIIPISILFFIRIRKEKEKSIFKFIPALTCFLIIILPFSIIDLTNHGEDGLISHISTSIKHVDYSIIQEIDNDDDWTDGIENNRIEKFLLKGFENLFRSIVIITIPISLFLIPYGISRIFCKINYGKLVIICIGFTLLIPAFYAYSRDFQDTKYLIPLIPIFSILSLYIIERAYRKINKTTIVNLAILSVIIVSSITVTELTKMDFEYEKEKFLVAERVVELSDGYLRYSPESNHIKGAEVKNNWLEKIPNDSNGHVERQTLVFDYEEFNTLDSMLKEFEYEGLTHLIIDQNDSRPYFLKHIFSHEKEYPFLEKEYDSDNDSLSYKVKIFKINYEKFKELSHEIIE